MNNIIITCGDINGVGPEIALKAINRIKVADTSFTYICPKNIFEKSSQLVNFDRSYFASNSAEDLVKQRNKVKILLLKNARPNIGNPTKFSGFFSYMALMAAKQLIDNYNYKILITSPLSKQSLKLAGYNFSGHTELIASWFNSMNYLMTFISKNFNAGLLTTHVPISSVHNLLTIDLLNNKLKIFYESLKNDFGISKPNVAVLSLNPHAGESGNIGKEEIDIITPVLNKMKNKNFHGPFVPDAFFSNKSYKMFDGVFGMYHDQILIPFKLLNFNNGVNFTAGLPIIRTSPDHGTAFDIAWKNKADENSMVNAIKVALEIKTYRKIK